MHSFFPVPDLKPAGHAQHFVAFMLAYFPETHSLQLPEPPAEMRPASHWLHTAFPAVEYHPAGQSSHAVAATFDNCPDKHWLQLNEPSLPATSPFEQGWQPPVGTVQNPRGHTRYVTVADVFGVLIWFDCTTRTT